MGSEGGEASSRGTLGEDIWSGLEVTSGAAAGVRSRITMAGDGEPLDRTLQRSPHARRDGYERLSAPLSRVSQTKLGERREWR